MIKKVLYECSMLPRYITASKRTLPNFIIAGVQKGGTSSLFKYLTQHPNILAPIRKQIHYFDMNYSRGKNWYRSFFPYNKQLLEHHITGEASPFYVYLAKVPHRVKQLLPEGKIIILLRDPVERTISHINHNKREGIEKREVEEILNSDLQKAYNNELNFDAFSDIRRYTYLARSVYVPQVEQWIKNFDKDQIYFAKSEDLFDHTRKTLEDILSFLGQNFSSEINYSKIHNKNTYPSPPEHIIEKLESFFATYNQKLSTLIGNKFKW